MRLQFVRFTSRRAPERRAAGIIARMSIAVAAAALAVALAYNAAHAQMAVPGLRDDFALRAGSGPLPDVYAMNLLYWYNSTEARDRGGNKIGIGGFNVFIDLVAFIYTSQR